MMKKFLMFVFALYLSPVLNAQQDTVKTEKHGLINWLTFAEAEAAHTKQMKPVMIDVYTDWCGWCKKLVNTTFSDPVIAQFMNLNMYCVRFNAETKDTLIFQGKKYWNPSSEPRSVHNLARELLGPRLSYPTLIFFNNNFKFKLLVPGYQSVKDIEPILVYMTEWIFNTTPVDDFRKNYQLATTPDSIRKDHYQVKWKKIEEIEKIIARNPRKVLIYFNTEWCNSCRIMTGSTFRDSAVVSYLEKEYYAVNFNAETRDTVIFKGEKYFVDGKLGNLNSLIRHLSPDRIILPSVVILDKDLNVITNIPQYYTPQDMNIILHFFAEDAYKTTKWEDYRNLFKAH